MEQRTRRSPARWLGPLALIAVVVALAAIVTGNDQTGGATTPGSGSKETSSASQPSATGQTTSKPAKSKTAARTNYVVQVGDSLSLIAVKTRIPLERLQELNPDVDSQNMIAGQKIRLK